METGFTAKGSIKRQIAYEKWGISLGTKVCVGGLSYVSKSQTASETDLEDSELIYTKKKNALKINIKKKIPFPQMYEISQIWCQKYCKQSSYTVSVAIMELWFGFD